jgi:hypothetical protein
MASSHDQHHGAATAGHEDPQTYEDAHADEHDGHGHDGHGHDDHGHDSHDDGHGDERSGWVLIPLGVGAAIAIVLILVFGVQSDAPERTDPIGATKTAEAGEHGSTADDEHDAEASDDEHDAEDAEGTDDEESTPTTHE